MVIYDPEQGVFRKATFEEEADTLRQEAAQAAAPEFEIEHDEFGLPVFRRVDTAGHYSAGAAELGEPEDDGQRWRCQL